jgi:hypothetical protein
MLVLRHRTNEDGVAKAKFVTGNSGTTKIYGEAAGASDTLTIDVENGTSADPAIARLDIIDESYVRCRTGCGLVEQVSINYTIADPDDQFGEVEFTLDHPYPGHGKFKGGNMSATMTEESGTYATRFPSKVYPKVDGGDYRERDVGHWVTVVIEIYDKKGNRVSRQTKDVWLGLVGSKDK